MSETRDRSRTIFGNRIGEATCRKAVKQKNAFLKKFGDDRSNEFCLSSEEIPELAALGIRNLKVEPRGTHAAGSSSSAAFEFPAGEKPMVIGNIRMGFGHYRIAIAMASAARSMGFTPYLFDLHSFKETTGGKIIGKLNALYSFGSRLSQKSALFNRFYWEPLNSEGFRKLAYNACDQKTAELMATPCSLLPRDIPFIATHVWPSQAAVHAGISRVVNAVPDNWPMALHLSEGAIHAVQTPSAWFGYKTLNGMDGKSILTPMPEGSLVHTGHYIDHELVSNLEADTAARIERLSSGKPLRILLAVGGAGAQGDFYASLLRCLVPLAKQEKVALFINVGDHKSVLEGLFRDVPELHGAYLHDGDWDDAAAYAREALDGPARGMHVFHNREIFSAVYITNLLMRASDILVTKPSELAFYPVPKLHIRRVGGHEAWGAVRSAEVGDGTIECPTPEQAVQMLSVLLEHPEALSLMNASILNANKAGVYSGAYRCAALAAGIEYKGDSQ